MNQMVCRALPDLAVGIEPQVFANLAAALVAFAFSPALAADKAFK